MSLMRSFEQLYTSFNRMFLEVCHDEGYNELTVNNYLYLTTIHLLDQPTVTELARHLNVKKASVTNMIDSLIDKGYVRKAAHASDKRSQVVQLTDKGSSIMHLEDKISEEFVDRFGIILTNEEMAEFERLIRKLADGIGDRA